MDILLVLFSPLFTKLKNYGFIVICDKIKLNVSDDGHECNTHTTYICISSSWQTKMTPIAKGQKQVSQIHKNGIVI